MHSFVRPAPFQRRFFHPPRHRIGQLIDRTANGDRNSDVLDPQNTQNSDGSIPPNRTKRSSEPKKLPRDFEPTEEQLRTAEHIQQIFPEADVEFIFVQLARKISVENLIERMMSGNYPKEKERLERERTIRRREELTNYENFDVAEFLLTFPDPESFFTNRHRLVGQLYVE